MKINLLHFWLVPFATKLQRLNYKYEEENIENEKWRVENDKDEAVENKEEENIEDEREEKVENKKKKRMSKMKKLE